MLSPASPHPPAGSQSFLGPFTPIRNPSPSPSLTHPPSTLSPSAPVFQVQSQVQAPSTPRMPGGQPSTRSQGPSPLLIPQLQPPSPSCVPQLQHSSSASTSRGRSGDAALTSGLAAQAVPFEPLRSYPQSWGQNLQSLTDPSPGQASWGMLNSSAARSQAQSAQPSPAGPSPMQTSWEEVGYTAPQVMSETGKWVGRAPAEGASKAGMKPVDSSEGLAMRAALLGLPDELDLDEPLALAQP